MLIDDIAYSNPLRKINPIEKFMFVMVILIIVLSTEKKSVFILNFLIFNMIILFVLKVSIKNLIKLYSIPMVFILMTVISFIWINYSKIDIFLLRTFSSISIIYFLVCSTPMVSLDYIFMKLKFPKIFRELFLLIYRYIFLLLDNKNRILYAQESRLGYSGYRKGLKSFPMLVTSIFRKTYYYTENSTKAIKSRLGSEFLFKQLEYDKIGKEIVAVIGIIIINIIMVVL